MPSARSSLERQGIFVAGAGLLVVLGLAAQFRSYVSPDTGFLLDEAARALRGSRLYVDLFDMNPPMTVVLNMAAVLFAWRFEVSEILAYRLGCTVVLLAALLLASLLLRRLLPGEPVLRRAIVVVLAFDLFILVGHDFGEREHLLLALIVPYVLLAAARGVSCRLSMSLALLVGALAASAFAIKPHFVLLWLAVEGYVRLTGRVPWGKLLPETFMILGFLSLYTLAVVIWSPGYLQIAWRFAGTYTEFLYVPFWQLMVRGPGALLTLFTVLAFAAARRHARHPELLDAFALASVVCLVAGAAQQKGFSYHFYPSRALSLVVLGILVFDCGLPARDWVGRVYRVITISLLATVGVVGCVRSAAAALRPVLDLEQQHMQELLPLVRARAAGQPIYVMSYNISSAYPLINYAGAHSASRFPQLWMFPAVYMEQLKSSRPLRYHSPDQMSSTERYLNQAVFEDLRDHRPKLLIILQHARDLPKNGFRRLNYVAYFSRDPRIARILERYQLVTGLGGYLIYERLPGGAERTGPPPRVQPGILDVAQGPNVGSVPAPIRDPGFRLALLVFVVGVIFASLTERGRAAAEVAPDSA